MTDVNKQPDIEALGAHPMFVGVSEELRLKEWKVTHIGQRFLAFEVVGEWSDYKIDVRLDRNCSWAQVTCAFALAPCETRITAVQNLAQRFAGLPHNCLIRVDPENSRGIVSRYVPIGAETCVRSATEELRLALETTARDCDAIIFPLFHRVAWDADAPDEMVVQAPYDGVLH